MAQESSVFYVETMQNLDDVKKIKMGLETLPGVKAIHTNMETYQVWVDYELMGISAAGLLNKLYAIGYESVLLRKEQSF